MNRYTRSHQTARSDAASENACEASHAPDDGFTLVLVQTLVQVLPPLKEHALTDKLEPGSESERVVLEHSLEIGIGNIFCSLDFVGVLVHIDIGLDEENVVD